MTTARRPRFSERLGLAEFDDDALYEGVPRHLVGPLQRWVGTHFSDYDEVAELLCLRLRFALLPGESPKFKLTSTDGMDLLDVVDAILSHEDDDVGGDFEDELARILGEAGSAYRVSSNGRFLELRMDETVRDAVDLAQASATAATAGSASEHLREAWQNVYGRSPNPSVAYSQAIKAVEAAAHAVLEPNNAKSTLGTMIRNLRDAPQNFRVAIDGPSGGEPGPVLGMLQMLWQGQTSRHGGQTPTRPETQEAAEMAVHLAAALVQWFTAGAVTRRT
ncbi:hypothetical protein ACFVVU_36060 [Kitasatospora sp. NPDC057965]|uniref:hypothetical protein n=1 Tax=Kitasatospora sp. NPDC057965 TaxID=3346291 RepID=UPI0036D8A748